MLRTRLIEPLTWIRHTTHLDRRLYKAFGYTPRRLLGSSHLLSSISRYLGKRRGLFLLYMSLMCAFSLSYLFGLACLVWREGVAKCGMSDARYDCSVNDTDDVTEQVGHGNTYDFKNTPFPIAHLQLWY